MTTYVTQEFTGSNGDTPGNLILGQTPTGGGCTIQSNKAEFKTGTAGGYNDTARVDRQVSVDGSTALSVVDAQVTAIWNKVSGESYPQIVVRASQANFNGQTGYFCDVVGTTFRIVKVVNYSETVLASITVAFTVGVDYTIRFRVVGSELQAWWGTASPDPSAPTLSVTDSALTAAGSVHLLVKTGSAASSSYVTMDNLEVTDAATNRSFFRLF